MRAAWRGAAAQLAGTRAQDIRDHSNAAADWTTGVARQLGLVADALGTAKSRMPPPPDHPLAAVLEGSAVASLKAAPAGPWAMGVQSVTAAGFGTFEQHRKNLEAKKRAVHVMQDYEKVIIGREFRPPPSRVDYSAPGPGDQPTGGSPAPQRLSTAAAVPAVASTTPAATAGGSGGTPVPGNAVAPGTGQGTAPATAVESSRTAPGAASPMRRPGFEPGSWRSFASGGRTGGYPGVGLPDLAFGDANPRAGQGLAGEPTGRAGSARSGLTGAGDRHGPLGPAGRGRKRGDDDKEHVNTLPQEHNLFDVGLVVGPAVIGGDDDR
ncbi:hypothetical protein [Labedaea rhizosphaerae]|uniref:PPE family protein n=1 Tax=Labedaea rhizosphaerae TaxID=598644 RepID=A0A4R6S2Q3_LABRH|nr:hypothetical protein [Labedaea rhizosphaerae]TDP93852.1 hypothetical protein EV186_106246 [Labedaea rhizosphaerae]